MKQSQRPRTELVANANTQPREWNGAERSSTMKFSMGTIYMQWDSPLLCKQSSHSFSFLTDRNNFPPPKKRLSWDMGQLKNKSRNKELLRHLHWSQTPKMKPSEEGSGPTSPPHHLEQEEEVAPSPARRCKANETRS